MKQFLFCLLIAVLVILPDGLSGQTSHPCDKIIEVQKRDITGLKKYIAQLELEHPDSFYCLGRANVELGIAFFNHNQLEEAIRLEEAIQYSKIALDYRKKTVPPIPSSIAYNCNNLGYFHQQRFEYEAAGRYYEEVLEYVDYLEDDIFITFLYQNLGNMKMETGDFNAAYEHYQLAVKKCHPLENKERLGNVLMGFGNLLNKMEKHGEAIDTLEKGILIFRKLEKNGEDMHEGLAGCYNNMGVAYLHKNDYQKAIEYFQSAFGLQTDLSEKVLLLNNMGSCFRKMGDFKNARLSLERGIGLALKNGWHSLAAQCLDNLGDVELQQGNHAAAISNYHRATTETIREFTDSDYRTNPTPGQISQSASMKELLLTYLTDKAKGWMTWYRADDNPAYLQYALETIKIADEVVQLMRREHSMQNSKLFWRQKTRPLYEMALEASFLSDDAQSAFYFFENSKSVLLLDALSALQARNTLDKTLADEETKLLRKLVRARELLDNKIGTTEETAARQTMLQAQRDFDGFIKKLAVQNPGNYQLRYDPPHVDIEQAKAKFIAPDGALIHYFLGDQHLYALSIAAQGAPRFLKVPVGEVEALLPAFFSSLNSSGQFDIFAPLAFQLYEKIYAPLLQEDIQSVIVIPDGQLAFIPFDALILDKQLGAVPSSTNFVISKQLVRYAYSASVLELQQGLNRRAKSILAFAPGFENGRDSLPALEKSGEALAALDFRNCIKREGAEATKNQFLSLASQYDILYLFTHASASGPLIELADSTLYLSELEASSLLTNLVILAACETGFGEIKKGEGVLNMASGFAYTGAASLISSLWKVPEAPTEKIFSRFFQGLPGGMNKAEALRQAKLDYLLKAPEYERTPYHWAAFVYFGQNGTAVVEPLSFLEKWGLWLLVAAVLLGVVIRWWKRKAE